MEPPPIRYAASARGQVAYQELGSGPVVVLVPPLAQHIEMMWEQPAFWRPLQRLASGFRIVVFDKLGTGLSDPAPERSTLDQRVDELRAVLDAAGVDRGWLLGLSEGGIPNARYVRVISESLDSTPSGGSLGRLWPRRRQEAQASRYAFSAEAGLRQTARIAAHATAPATTAASMHHPSVTPCARSRWPVAASATSNARFAL